MAREAPHAGNPFSTRYVRPGALGYQFPPGTSADALLRPLASGGGFGAIVGPHGSGKSTLVATLVEHRRANGEPTSCLTLRDGQRRLPAAWRRDARQQPGTLLIVDGYEQLGRWQRWRVRRWCRRNGVPLLVTAHQDVGLPVVHRTATSAHLLWRLVNKLAGDAPSWITQQEVEAIFVQTAGNLREALFLLYDRYEALRDA
jgi:GTPase SAR1 family protein